MAVELSTELSTCMYSTYLVGYESNQISTSICLVLGALSLAVLAVLAGRALLAYAG